jgi:hypothetical protein
MAVLADKRDAAFRSTAAGPLRVVDDIRQAVFPFGRRISSGAAENPPCRSFWIE